MTKIDDTAVLAALLQQRQPRHQWATPLLLVLLLAAAGYIAARELLVFEPVTTLTTPPTVAVPTTTRAVPTRAPAVGGEPAGNEQVPLPAPTLTGVDIQATMVAPLPTAGPTAAPAELLPPVAAPNAIDTALAPNAPPDGAWHDDPQTESSPGGLGTEYLDQPWNQNDTVTTAFDPTPIPRAAPATGPCAGDSPSILCRNHPANQADAARDAFGIGAP